MFHEILTVYLISQLLLHSSMKSTIFRNVTPCSLVAIHRVSEELTASIFNIADKAKRVTSKK
jgi:hypothetical protein